MSEEVLDEAELRRRFPEIPWDNPLLIKVGPKEGFACRICIGLKGLRAREYVPESYGDVIAHLANEHEVSP